MTPAVDPSHLVLLRLQNDADDTALEYDHFKVAICHAADRKFMAARRVARFINQHVSQNNASDESGDGHR